MNLIYTKRSSTGVALVATAFALLGLIVVFADDESHYSTYLSFWVAAGIAAIAVILISIHSYYLDRRGYSKKQLHNARGTFKSLALMGRNFWLLVGLVMILVALDPNDPSAILMGATLSVFLMLGIVILLDNFLLHHIFVWNSSHPQMRKLYARTRGNK